MIMTTTHHLYSPKKPACFSETSQTDEPTNQLTHMSVLREFFLLNWWGALCKAIKQLCAHLIFFGHLDFSLLCDSGLRLSPCNAFNYLDSGSHVQGLVLRTNQPTVTTFPSSASGVTFISVVSHLGSELVGWMLKVMVEMVVEVVEDKELLD